MPIGYMQMLCLLYNRLECVAWSQPPQESQDFSGKSAEFHIKGPFLVFPSFWPLCHLHKHKRNVLLFFYFYSPNRN